MRRVLALSVGIGTCLAALLSVRAARAEDAPKDPPPAGGEKKEADRNATRGYVCIQWGLAQKFSPEERSEKGIPIERGLVITSVTTDGPADRAGVRVGDVPLQFFGEKLPDAKDLPGDDDDKFAAFMKEHTRPIADKIDPGMTVELVVVRDGKEVTFKMVAVDANAAEALNQAMIQEENAVKVPRPVDRGTPGAAKVDFQQVPDGEVRPAQFLQVTGYWEVTDDQEKPGNKVIVQGVEETGDCVGLIVADGRAFTDSTAKVRFLLMRGERSASAGIVLRAKDRRNYYALRVDGVTQDLAIVRVDRGEAKVLASSAVKSPKLNTWLTLTASATGSKLSVTFGDVTVTAEDPTFPGGWSGLMTTKDAVTAFDDLELAPGAK